MILAGMDTTANSITRVLQILSERQDVQDKLRAEILQAVEMAGDGEMLSFDQLMELPYLDAVCRESFRVYVRDEVDLRHHVNAFMSQTDIPMSLSYSECGFSVESYVPGMLYDIGSHCAPGRPRT